MYIDLSGEWKISLEADEGRQSGTILLPGILQAAGYGNPVTKQTPWVSALHDSFWYEQEEYKYAQEEGVNVPFLSQPPRHFLGKATYERTLIVPEETAWHFHVEAARWRSQVWVDGELKGEDCSLCGPHDIKIGKLAAGEHTLRVVMDNSMLYPYRPDAHAVSDALGATWNGMVGEIALFTEDESRKRREVRKAYAKAHPRTVEARDGRFLIDGQPFYFRATHFGGDYPLTGYPVTDKAWWHRIMGIMKEWGLNGIRFHSYCPPEAAFAAADEEGMCLLVECGMWNRFGEDPNGEKMYQVLFQETRRILENFGHHPSFMLFSPSNEPSGPWYGPLKKWVSETRAYDEELGYGGRRIYTAQSGWPYDVPPAEIEGTDFIYFHRSGKGFRKGGMIRGQIGWKGGNYSAALPGVKKPVICHEMGQICAYPDYDIVKKYTGYMQPGNYKVFRENARANGILPYAEDFVKCSGENQLRLYKEELEANFRTPELQGFELLDLHDYLGQGTALVGILDAFWENKGYGSPEEFRNYCGDTVLLARSGSYVWKNTDTAVIPVEVCHYGKESIINGVIQWRLQYGDEILQSGELVVEEIHRGGNTEAGEVTLCFEKILENYRKRIFEGNAAIPGQPMEAAHSMEEEHSMEEGNSTEEEHSGENAVLAAEGVSAREKSSREAGEQNMELTLTLELPMYSESGRENCVSNNWKLYVFTKPEEEMPTETEGLLYTRDWKEAKAALEAGRRVVYSPYLSDLNYECPLLSGGSVGWNGQMGPTWCRTMGVVIDEKHPIFKYFPTGKSGGWQWEDILKNSRGFHMEGLEQVKPIVQPVDDWNRNLLQGLLFEAEVLNGKLLVVSANLEGTFDKRPEAYSLKQAILKYAASEAFCVAVSVPKVDIRKIEDKLFPILRMSELTKEISYGNLGEEGKVKDGIAIMEADPGTSVRVMKAAFPVQITITLQRPIAMKGFLYVPEQRDREHEGFAKEYRLEVRNGEVGRWELAAEGTFLNTCRSQRILFEREVTTEAIRLIVQSAYGCEDKYVWESTQKGWEQCFIPQKAVVQIAGIHVICEEEASHSDVFTTAKSRKTRTNEIEL